MVASLRLRCAMLKRQYTMLDLRSSTQGCMMTSCSDEEMPSDGLTQAYECMTVDGSLSTLYEYEGIVASNMLRSAALENY
jgi:hypothetical protein